MTPFTDLRWDLPDRLGPKALDRTRLEAPLAVASLLLLLLICAADVVTPVNVVFEGLALVVLGVTAWLVGVRWVVAVTVAAVLLNFARAAVGSTSWITVVIDGFGL